MDMTLHQAQTLQRYLTMAAWPEHEQEAIIAKFARWLQDGKPMPLVHQDRWGSVTATFARNAFSCSLVAGKTHLSYSESISGVSREPEALEPAVRILEGKPPMSFQEAKTVLYPHLETRNYLQLALHELAALDVTKAIKKAAGDHLRKAASDFESRRKFPK